MNTKILLYIAIFCLAGSSAQAADAPANFTIKLMVNNDQPIFCITNGPIYNETHRAERLSDVPLKFVAATAHYVTLYPCMYKDPHLETHVRNMITFCKQIVSCMPITTRSKSPGPD